MSTSAATSAAKTLTFQSLLRPLARSAVRNAKPSLVVGGSPQTFKQARRPMMKQQQQQQCAQWRKPGIATKNNRASSSLLPASDNHFAADSGEEFDLGSGHSLYQKVPPREETSDLVVVLDMDECLLHSQFFHEEEERDDTNNYAHQVLRREDDEDSHFLGNDRTVDHFYLTLNGTTRVKVHKRPHLDLFLKKILSRYETHIFTAAMEVYARPVLEHLMEQQLNLGASSSSLSSTDPNNFFSGIWYRDTCTLDNSTGAYVKNLNSIQENFVNKRKQGNVGDTSNRSGGNSLNGNCHLARTVLVDNNPLSFLANPTNGILVSHFYNDVNDDTLLTVLELLEELEDARDVRPVLDAKFGLSDALLKVDRKKW